MQIQAVSELQKRGCLTVLFYIFLLFVPVLGWVALFMLIRGKKSKTNNYAVCQKCGYRTAPSKVKNVQLVKQNNYVLPKKPDTLKAAREYKRPDVMIPDKIGDCVRLYLYTKLRIAPVSNAVEIVNVMQETNDWILTAKKTQAGIELDYHGEPFAALLDKVDMVSDWIERGDPMFICLKSIGESGQFVLIAFYRDEQKRLANRENTVIKLIKYANQDAQSCMIGLTGGEKLDLEEDLSEDDVVSVSSCNGIIGYLPKKYANRYMEEGCAGAFLDRIEEGDNMKDVPYIKIYW